MEIISGTMLNGAMTHCAQLTRELARRGHEITLLCLPESWIANNLADLPIDVLYSQMHRFPTHELRRIAEEVRRRKIDVVHSHMSRAHFFGVLLRWFAGVPSVATAHSQYFQLHWRYNDLVIAVSDATRRFHHRFNLVPKNRIVTIHNFIQPSAAAPPTAEERAAIRKSLGAGGDELLMAIVGSVFPIKGHLHLIRAMPKITSAVGNARLAIVGEERVPEYGVFLRKEAENLGVADRIVWTGQHPNVPGVMASIDICVGASWRENLPMVILEAMSAGTPVVATNVGGIPECVIHNKTGMLVKRKNSEALADALIELLRDPAKRAALGQAGKLHVRENFSLDTQVSLIENALQSIVRR